MRKVTIVIVGVLLCVGMVSLSADEEAKISDGRLKAALELLDTMQMDTMLSKSIDSMLDIQIKQAPQMESYREIMFEFFEKYMSWSNMKDDMVQIYAEAFMEGELKEITAFYKTPTGQKVVKMMPILMNKGSELGARRVQEHMGELQMAIMAERMRLMKLENQGNVGDDDGVKQ